MRLPSGTRLGPYEVLGPLGAGGMGEVYRARDTRLGREVALKVIGDLSTTAEVHERFEREARTVSQLSHPNVCTVHDVGREGDVHYFVMELLEGESLDRRLTRGALPVSEVLRIGAQIADGLAAAHGRGIAHRDLKPGNVMLTRSGVKLLDFGLAKTIAPPAAGDASRAPTIDVSLTVSGALVGTIPYMAPEQIEGRPAGPPADIFALGCVLYEMATGRRPFEGGSTAALMSAILTSEPPPIASVRPAPAAFERIVRNCLAKDPAQRWHSAADLAIQLRMVAEGGDAGAVEGAVPASRRTWIAWSTAALMIVIAALALLRPGPRSAPARPVHLEMSPPPGHSYRRTFESSTLAVSPDGTRIAFIAADSAGIRRVWVRDLAAPAASAIAGTEDARSIMWSPDGRSIAFFQSRELRRVPLAGGTPVTICDLSAGVGPIGSGMSGSWGRGNVIVFAGVQGEAVYRVSADGGTPSVVVRADSVSGRLRWTWPNWLPDGDRFLCLIRRAGEQDSVFLVDLDGKAQPVMAARSNAQYVDPGWLLTVSEGTLLAQRFDARAGRVEGSPVALANDIAYFLSTGEADYSSSRNGTLAYSTSSATGRLEWIDAEGDEAGSVGPPGGYLDVAISPDGSRALYSRATRGTGDYDIWSIDLANGSESRITTSRNSEFSPLWLPGQREIIYAASIGRPPWLHRRNLETGATILLRSEGFEVPGSLSPDGRTVFFHEFSVTGNGQDILQMPVDGSGPAIPWRSTSFNEALPRISPDGRSMAFVSDESGRFEAYVAPYPGPGEKLRLSQNGVRDLHWNRRAGTLMYLESSSRLLAVPVFTAPVLRIGRPVVVGSPASTDDWRTFDVAPDGGRVLMVVGNRGEGMQPLEVIVHWPGALDR